ncbi:MAG TPA: sarcosine oxidase subunit gamma family protein [Dongiaceae bacterium]|nr:sarcosine oxidase subunit gamma family protein [Dongiaceae bacterium]
MVETYQRRTPLAHLGLVGRAATAGKVTSGVTMSEIGHRAIINIRGTASDPAFAAAVKSATGVDLPAKSNTATSNGDRQILWLGPNEWWVTAKDGEAEHLLEALRNAFGGQHATACDVSESRAIIVVKGAKARDLLARGVSLDLHPKVFTPGQCAQTGLSRCNVLLHLTDDSPRFEIYVLKSFSDYLWRWLEQVAVDFDLGIEA